MSASGDAESFLRRARGRRITEIAQTGVGAWLLALFASIIAGMQQVFELLILPFVLFIDVAEASVQAFFIEPFGLVPVGVRESARGLFGFGIAGLPVAVVVVLVTFVVIVWFLQMPITSNILPGFILDNRLVDFLFTSPEEEGEGEA